MDVFYKSDRRTIRIKINAAGSGTAFQVLLFALEVLIAIQLSGPH